MENSNENRRRRRNSDRRYASDYYINANQQNWGDESRQREYGLPTNGRLGRRRIFQSDHILNTPPDNQRRDNRDQGREYDYNRFGMGEQGGTWNQRGDESYDFGESNERNRPEGKHRGKGPKGFTRTDERIKEDINSRLTDDAYLDASDIEVEVTNGEVTLTGTVTDRSSKRRAEDIAELVSGVSNVENRLRVK